MRLPLAVLSTNATNEDIMARNDGFNDKRRLYCIEAGMMMTYMNKVELCI